jgi:hypothetical protein
MFGTFTDWRNFPDPRKGELLVAPFGSGCYELRRIDDGQLVLFGTAGHVALRMTSLLPEPYGAGVRNNQGKRDYVLAHMDALEYRTISHGTKEEAAAFEAELAGNRASSLFQT